MVKAKYVNTHPEFKATLERSFIDRRNAIKWLGSFGKGKYDEHYINGESVTEELKSLFY